MTTKDVSTPRVFLCRHGETPWSKTGQHTGRTEVELTDHGVAQVRATGKTLFGPGKLVDLANLSEILVSPRKRAQQTASLFLEELSGRGKAVHGDDTNAPDGVVTDMARQRVQTVEALTEWEYGRYEGLTPKQIKEDRQARGVGAQGRGWDIWRDGCEEGESPEEVTKRLDEVIAKIKTKHESWLAGSPSGDEGSADVLLVAHGHILRAFAKRWLGYSLDFPLSMMLEPGGVGVLSYQHHNVDEPAFLLGIALPTGPE